METVETEEKIVRKSVKLELPCRLTDAEELEIARTKAQAEGELEERTAEFAEQKTAWQRRLGDIEKRIAAAGATLRTQEQKRVVDCYERYAVDGEHAGKIETVRKDTGDVVARRYADLLEARQAIPPPPGETEPAPNVLDAAANMQHTGVAEDADGDVVPTDAAAPRGKRKARSKRS